MPRKPGGKYRGKVARVQGEDRLKAKADAQAQMAMEASIRRLNAAKAEKQRAARRGLQTAQQEEEERVRQKIANLLLNTGAKQLPRKYFNAWQVGVAKCIRERDRLDRETRWRAHCTTGDEDKSRWLCDRRGWNSDCPNIWDLHDVSFQLPSAHHRNLAHLMAQRGPSAVARHSTLSVDAAELTMTSPTSPAPWSPTRSLLSPSRSSPSSSRRPLLESFPTPSPSGRSCSLPSLASPSQVDDPATPRGRLFLEDCTTEVFQASTGRKMLYDRHRAVARFVDEGPLNAFHSPSASKVYDKRMRWMTDLAWARGPKHVEARLERLWDADELPTFEV